MCRPASSHSHPWAKAAGFDSGPSSSDSATHLHTQYYGGPVPGTLPEQQPPAQPRGGPLTLQAARSGCLHAWCKSGQVQLQGLEGPGVQWPLQPCSKMTRTDH